MRHEVLFGVLAMVCIGLADLVRRRAMLSSSSPSTFFLVETLFLGVFTTAAVLILEQGVKLDSGGLIYAPASGFFVAIGILSLLIALTSGEANRFVPLARLGFVITFLLATFLFSEKITLSRVVGIAFAFGAVILLSTDIG